MPADPHATATLATLAEIARVERARLPAAWLGLTVTDCEHAAWLGYAETAARGRPHPAALVRARYAVRDLIRTWGGIPADTGRGGTGRPLGQFVAPHVAEDALAAVPATGDGVASRPLPRTVRRAYRTLPPRQRTALRYWARHGITHAAAHCGVPIGTCARRVHDAVQAMRCAVIPPHERMAA